MSDYEQGAGDEFLRVILPAGILPRKAGTHHTTESFVLADQMRTIDYRIRRAERVSARCRKI